MNLTGGDDAREFRGVTGCRSVACFSALHRQLLFTWNFQTLRPEQDQPFAVQIQIAEREAGSQPIVVLCQAAISHLVEAKDALEDAERMFHSGSYFRFYPVLFPL